MTKLQKLIIRIKTVKLLIRIKTDDLIWAFQNWLITRGARKSTLSLEDYADPLYFNPDKLDDEKYTLDKIEQVLASLPDLPIENYSIGYLEKIAKEKKPIDAIELRKWVMKVKSNIKVELAYDTVYEKIRILKQKKQY